MHTPPCDVANINIVELQNDCPTPINQPLALNGEKLKNKRKNKRERRKRNPSRETIRLQKVDEIKKKAMEKIPEWFYRSPMLYVRIVVNGVSTLAFIDSGATTTFMSLSFAKKAQLEQLIDTGARELFLGCGKSRKTMGTIYLCSFNIGNAVFHAKVDVCNNIFDVAIGLDFLQRYKCVIDSKGKRLIINETTSAEFIDAHRRQFMQNESRSSIELDEYRRTELIELALHKQTAEDQHPQKGPEYNNDEEMQCKTLFKEMNNLQMRSKMYNLWPVLYDHFIGNPLDYVGFARTFAIYWSSKKKLQYAVANPDSAEGQALSRETLRRENCDKMKQQAMEMMPEPLNPKLLLHVKIAVNGVNTLAFIDSGAEACFIDFSFAKMAQLAENIDTRRTYDIHGSTDVHTGLIYLCSFKIGNIYHDAANVLVSNGAHVVIIGLNFLRHHKCILDLRRNKLILNEKTHVELVPDAEVNKFMMTRASLSSSKVDKEKLEKIVGMGFDTNDAEDALKRSRNDVSAAIDMLYESLE